MKTAFDDQIVEFVASTGLGNRQRAFLSYGMESGGPGTEEMTRLRKMETDRSCRWWTGAYITAGLFARLGLTARTQHN
jgi:hypothetical protein